MRWEWRDFATKVEKTIMNRWKRMRVPLRQTEGEGKVKGEHKAARYGTSSLTEAIIMSFSGGKHCLRLIETCLTPSYLVEESLENAGSFDWQRARDSDLFFQYYCRRWEKWGGCTGGGGEIDCPLRLKWQRKVLLLHLWVQLCQICSCWQLQPSLQNNSHSTPTHFKSVFTIK